MPRITHGVCTGEAFRWAAGQHSPWDATAHKTEPKGFCYQGTGAIATRVWEERMRNVIIAVVVIVVIAAALWFTPQGRSLLQKFGVASADLTMTTDIS